MANIVVIDDEEALAELYAFQLTSIGHAVTEFVDSRKAFAHLKANCPDGIVTDVRMPHVSGIDICKFVRANYPNTALVVVSGYSEVESELRFLGVDHVLKKPFRLDELSAAMTEALLDKTQTKKAG